MAEESSSQPKQSGISQDKQWQCPLCPKGYHDSRNLRRHVVTKHPEEKDLPDVISATKSRDDCREECPHCSKTFVELRKHIKKCSMNPQRIHKDPQESFRKFPQKRSLDLLSNLEFENFDKAKLQKTVQPSTVSAHGSASNEDVKAKLCGIGTSAVMGQQNHLKERYKSYLGGDTRKETEYDPRPELPALSRDESASPSSPVIVSDDEEVQVGFFKNPFYRSPSSDRNATEVSDFLDTSAEFLEAETPEAESTKNNLQDTNAFSPNDCRTDMAPGPSSGVRSNSPPPGLVVTAEEEDSIIDSQELARAREKADREFAEMLHQREEGQQPVGDMPEVARVRNMDFWTKFDKFLDTFHIPGQQKEAYGAFVRSFCEFAEKVPEDLLMWGDLDVLPRDLCKRADVPFCETWLDGFEKVKDKQLAAEAYETLLQFLATLLPSMVDSDEEDRELIQLRLNVLLALVNRLRDLDLNGKGKGKGKGDKKNKK